MKRHTLLIVEDHTLLRETWKLLLGQHPQLEVVATCGSGEEAVRLAARHTPAVVLMDIKLKGMNGIETTAQIRAANPAVRVLCVSLYNSVAYVKKIMAAGASGYVSKYASREEMVEALERVAGGGRYLSRDIQSLVAEEGLGEKQSDAFGLLTRREREIIDQIKGGASSKEIAAALGLTTKTVEVHRCNILRKLKQKNTAALVNFLGIR